MIRKGVLVLGLGLLALAAAGLTYVNETFVLDNGGGAAFSTSYQTEGVLGHYVSGSSLSAQYVHSVGFFAVAAPPAPAGNLAALRSAVETLVTQGNLLPSYGNVLIQMLDSAALRVRQGNYPAAITLLKSFKGYVAKYVAAGALADGSSLLSQADALINALAGLSAGLVGSWRLDDGAGSQAKDGSGNSLHGALVNGPAWTAGKVGKALSFNGVDQRVVLPGATFPAGTAPRSLTAWARARTLGSGWIAAYGAATPMTIGLQGGTLRGGDLSVAGFWDSVTWRHVALTYDGATARLYADGVERAAGPKAWSLTPGAAVLGASASGIESWDGWIDEVRLYDRALAPYEVSLLSGNP